MVKMAALDLGSNSFHLLDAVYHENKLHFGNRLKEKVQIGAGLDVHKNLSQSAINRGLACIDNFYAYINEHNIQHLIAVGTNTLRVANNSREFTSAAEKILNIPVNVISGKDEAKLIFSAVCEEKQQKQTGLVIDIGGGSTEFALGDRSSVNIAESLSMGCISYYQRFYADGKIYPENVSAAVKAARLEIEPYLDSFLSIPTSWITGTSGTMQSLASLTHHIFGDPEHTVTRESLISLEALLIDLGHVQLINFDALDKNRREILPAGLAIARAIFDTLDLDRITICQSALCEGLLLELKNNVSA